MDRRGRQDQVREWMLETFGAVALEPEERVLRLFEEVVELAQSSGVDPERLRRIILYVYARPAGAPMKEAGQVGVTLLALCSVAGWDADALERQEVERITSLPKEKFRARQAEKGAAGVGSPMGVGHANS